MPTLFTADNQIDIEGFKLLIARQIKYGTSQLFILGSAGEVTLLTLEEKKLIVRSVLAYMKDRAARGLKTIPVFFSAASLTTEASVEFAQFCEAEGADGVVFTVPPYVLITQHAAKTHLDTCMSSVKIPCGIYNNPSRLGVQVLPETIQYLAEKHENFVVDKEALPSVEQLVQVQRLCEGKVKIMCCDYPHYSIVIRRWLSAAPARPTSAATSSRRKRPEVFPPVDGHDHRRGMPSGVLQVVPAAPGALHLLQPDRHQGGAEPAGFCRAAICASRMRIIPARSSSTSRRP